MGARYDNIGGVQHKVSKRFVNIGGVQHPVSKRYDNIGGVWRPGYSGAITWVSTLVPYSANKPADGFSIPNDSTLFLHLEGFKSDRRGVTATFIFSEPINLPANNAVEISTSTQRPTKYVGWFQITLSSPDEKVPYSYPTYVRDANNQEYNGWYCNLAAARSVTSLSVFLAGDGIDNTEWLGDSMSISIRLHPVDRPAFLVCGLNTSDQ